MSGLRVVYLTQKGQFSAAMREINKPIATTAKAAIVDMAGNLKAEGRGDIAAAGFSKKWQNALRVNTYPKGSRVSIDSAALIFHKIPYSDIFELGGTIRGKKGKLWIPLKSAPKYIGKYRVTPDRYVKNIGPLFTIKRAGKPPLLAANAVAGRGGKVSLASLRRGAGGAGLTRAVPLFVGVDSVTLRKRFHLIAITNRNAATLPELYIKHFRDE